MFHLIIIKIKFNITTTSIATTTNDICKQEHKMRNKSQKDFNFYTVTSCNSSDIQLFY